MDQIEKYLAQLINDPENDFINFELAYAYEKEKQYAAAVSYYLRCAEYTNDNTLGSECLIRCSFSMNKQGGRDQKELHFIKQAMGASPCSLEPYYIASLYFSWRGNHRDSYLYTCLGINIYENNIQKEKFIKDVGFSIYDLYYQKAFTCSNIGKINESIQLYVKILQEFDIRDSTKENILKKINELPEPNHPIVSYTKLTKDKLKYQFPNCEEINENFSQIYQDIFVLSMNDGKKNGTYFEVGAGYPIKGNNTFLLETQFDWQGISIDMHPDSKDLFDKNRKNECICTDATSIDYIQLFSEHYKSTSIDYLQLDCDPANITYDILEKIPFDTYKFGVITYEHDFYNDHTGSYREKSRSFLKNKGYKLICGNISPLKDKYPFEDWWIHPDLIDENIWKHFERTDDVPINGEKYMLTKSNNYKNFISIGGWCGAKIALKKLGLFDEASLPFDDVRSSMKGIIDCFENNFENYFPKEIYEDNRSLNCPHFIGEYIGFYHDNHNLLDINVIESFKRKIVRFDKKIKKNNCIFIRTICREKYDDEIKQYKNLQFAIDKKYPNISYIICFIIPNQVNTQYYKHIDNRTFLFTLNDTSLDLFDGIVTDAYKPIFDFIMDTNLFVNIPEPNIIEIIDAPSRLWLVQPEGHPMVNFIKEKAETIIDNKAFMEKKTKMDSFVYNNEFDCKIYSPKIIDCFIFYNELDLLNYRLNLLDDYVDYFVLVEATHTHTGKEKKLFYNENKELFEKFKDKIIHIIVHDFPYKYPDVDVKKNQQWENENFQRNCIKRGIDKLTLHDNDLVVITDLDEIPNPEILNKIKENKKQITISSLKMDMYYYNLNCKTKINDWISPKIISYKEFTKLDITIHDFRYKKTDNIIENGGWHLSFFGDKEFIANKIENYGHQEFNNDEILKNIEEKIKSKKDLFNRENHEIQYIDIEDNDNLPPEYDIYLKNFYTKTEINKIPKKIFQTWETSENELSPDMQYYINSWKEKNPDYEFHFYNANERYEFIKDNFDHEVLDAYNRLKPGAFKCDLWRICILYIHGGFYTDIDTLCCNSINIINTNVDFICAIDLNIVNKYELSNGFIGSVSKHKILKLYIDKIIYNMNNIDHKTQIESNIICGPGCFGHVVNEYLNLPNTNSFIGNEGIINNTIHFLKFEKKDEFVIDTITNVKILQNKNGNINIKTAYDKECKKIKSFFCWGKFGEIVYITDLVDFETKLEILEDEPLNIIIEKVKTKKSIKDLYDFIPCHDQKGNDIYRVSKENLQMTLQNASNDPSIVAINTEGYVKNNIEKLEQINGWVWDIKANKADGIYIKKTSNNTLVKCSQSSIPVLGILVCTTTKWVEKQLQSIDFPVENYIIINNNENFLAEKLDILVSKGHEFIKNFKVYHMPYNLGCAEGWNTIIKSFLFSPYWVIVNDDVSFTPGFLKELHETALENPDAGMVHGKPIYIPNMNKFGSFDMFLIRDWVIKDYGLFDINYYPAYLEDYDYIFRLRNSSVKIINQLKHKYYHGDTLDYNVSGKNTQKFSNELSNKLINIRYKNYNYFLKKWNAWPESINENNINDIYKYPFNNPANKLSMISYDIEFVREKDLLNSLPKKIISNKEITLKIEEKAEIIEHISFPRPNVIVIDNFYKNVDEIREYALEQTYKSPENHGAVGYRCESGKKIMDGTKEMFEKLMGGTIPNGSQHGEWGYSTNGCFQWCNARVPIVYHCDSQKYAGIIYLTPNAPPNCGTSFFRHKNYKIRNSSIFSKSDWYKSDLNHKEPHLDKTQWEIVDSVGNVYNRLVIFDAQYIHAVTEYFGEDINNSRLFQLFFFNIN